MSDSGKSGFLIGMLLFFVPILDCWCLGQARQNAREKNGIPGNFLGDLIASIFCGPCVLVQTKTEFDGHTMGGDIERV